MGFLCSLHVTIAQNTSSPVIKGTWVTNVASEALLSKENIRQTVKRAKDAGLNTLFVVVWNGGYTLYPSLEQQQHIGIRQHPDFKGRDPCVKLSKKGIGLV